MNLWIINNNKKIYFNYFFRAELEVRSPQSSRCAPGLIGSIGIWQKSNRNSSI